MKLWIDDLRVMPKIYDQHARNYDEAIAWLSTNEVEEASFDHDLGEGKTGYDIASWVELMAHNKELKPFKWKVHSANPTGAKHILIALSNADKYWYGVNN